MCNFQLNIYVKNNNLDILKLSFNLRLIMFKTNSNISLILYCFWLSLLVGAVCSEEDQAKKNPRGQLVGTLDRDGFEMSAQYGMVYIPTGRFPHMGQADENIQADQSNFNRQVTISAFYMDDTEITNDEYRQFMQYLEENPDYELSEGATIESLKPDTQYGQVTLPSLW